MDNFIAFCFGLLAGVIIGGLLVAFFDEVTRK
jgi:hypothetical protein